MLSFVNANRLLIKILTRTFRYDNVAAIGSPAVV